MKLSLSTNIQKFRKEKGLTQEELAESLGVTFASVSKWERGVATPDLELIASMASIFNISVDTLIGFNMNENSLDEYKKRIELLFENGKYEEAVNEIEDVLFRYPNDFNIVHDAAVCYFYFGTRTENSSYYKKAIELLERSIILIPTTADDRAKSEIEIRGEIAQCYELLKEYDKCIEILKKYNTNGTFDYLIAYSMTQEKNFKKEEARSYIRSSFNKVLSELFSTMWGLSNYYKENKEYSKGIESILWLQNFLNSLKIDLNEICYFDKLVSVSNILIANLYNETNDLENTKKYLNLSKEMAIKFDQNPTYNNTNIRYMLEGEDDMFADGLGNSATSAVEKEIKNYPKLTPLWEDIKNEKE